MLREGHLQVETQGSEYHLALLWAGSLGHLCPHVVEVRGWGWEGGSDVCLTLLPKGGKVEETVLSRQVLELLTVVNTLPDLAVSLGVHRGFPLRRMEDAALSPEQVRSIL